MSVEAGSTTWCRTGLARTVAADLDAIFAEVRTQAHGPAHARSLKLVGGHGLARPRRLPIASLGAVAAAALIGLAAGTFVPSTPAQAPTAPAPSSPPPVQAAMIAPLPSPIPAPAEAKPQPAVETRQAPDRPRATKAANKARACARARCSRSEVMDADHRLRNAYFRAVKAGVPRPVLVSYRDRWARLRVNAKHEPQRLVTGYRTLATGLTREARRS